MAIKDLSELKASLDEIDHPQTLSVFTHKLIEHVIEKTSDVYFLSEIPHKLSTVGINLGAAIEKR